MKEKVILISIDGCRPDGLEKCGNPFVEELKEKYQKVYGPLTINYPCNKWRWLEQPWPWERGNY